jgi:hypothetical protein
LSPSLKITKRLAGVVDTGGSGGFWLGDGAQGSGGEMADISTAVLHVFLVVSIAKRRIDNWR